MKFVSTFFSFFQLAFYLLLLPNSAFAQSAPPTYTLMAPLGSILSGAPDLTTYLKGAVVVIIGVAGLLAVIMVVHCGIRLMVSQSSSGRSAAKECIWNAIFGLLLALGAWVLLYTINPLLLSSELKLTDVAQSPAPGTANTAIPPGIYQWSADATCGQVAGKIVAAIPPSYCSGTAPSVDAVCCGYVNSPLRQPTPTPTSSPTPISSPSPTPTPMPSPSPTLTPTPSPSPTPTPTGDTTPPSVLISSPQSNLPATSATVNVTFTANDNAYLRRIEYVYTPPSGTSETTLLCNTDCLSPSTTMTIPVAIRFDVPGTHTVLVRACDSKQCFARQISVIVEASCVPNPYMTCKVLPGGGAAGAAMCSSSQTSGITVGLSTDAIAFKITSIAGGGSIYVTTDKNARPPAGYSSIGSCTGGSGTAGSCTVESNNAGNILPADCFCYTTSDGDPVCIMCIPDSEGVLPRACRNRTTCDPDTEDCTPPENLIASISAIPGDLTSTTATAYNTLKGVSGYCGNAYDPNDRTLGASGLTFTASVNSTGPNICKIEKDRTYYLNVTTIPFIDSNTTYYIYWRLTL